ncbi:biotin transporter BioY [Lachnospiraceae bacterium]|nr:biotin transporter BioY [Lachnospiraceae bacterium]
MGFLHIPVLLYFTYERRDAALSWQQNIMKNITTTTPGNTSGPFSTQRLVLIAMVTSITCILAPFSIPIPISPVPISLTNLVLLISVYVLGWKDATVSFLIYLLIGAAGLPVFSGFAGGLGKIAGPTGGYLVGFIFMTIIAGIFVERFRDKRFLIITGMALATVVTYLFGTAWLAFQLEMPFTAALSIGVIPYLPGDTAKIILAVVIGPILYARLHPLID